MHIAEIMNMTNEEQLKKSYKDSKETEQILMSKPGFKDAVAMFRGKWGIPKNGLRLSGRAKMPLSAEERKDYDPPLTPFERWQAWLMTNTRPSEEDMQREVARQVRITRTSTDIFGGLESLINTESIQPPEPKRMLQNDIAQILIDNDLNPRWFVYLERYLLFNDKITVPSGMALELSIDDASGLEIILLKITGEVSKADLLSVLSTINTYQWGLPYQTRKKAQPKRSLSKYKGATEILESKGAKAAVEWLDSNYPKKSGDTHGYEDVYKMKSLYRKYTASS